MTGKKNALCSMADYSISRGRLAFEILKNICPVWGNPLGHKELM
jgi:hypothetical protein